METYEHLSDVPSVFVKLLLNVCTTITKLFIVLACIITTCIEISIKILVTSVIYVIQFSSGVALMLVEELWDLFVLAKAILIMIQK